MKNNSYNILEYLRPVEKLPIIEWAEKHIDFSLDATNAYKGKLQLRKYQKEILEASDRSEVREIDVIGSQQTGKSLIWKLILLKQAYDGGLTSTIIYPNEQLALESNRDTLEPLMRAIPKLAKDLSKVRSKTNDSYHLQDCNSIIRFQGGGTQVISRTCRIGIMDEADFHNLPGIGQGSTSSPASETKNVDNVYALTARMATYRDSSLLYISSTPTTNNATITKRYNLSNQATFHLCCLHCGNLMPCTQLAFPQQDGSFAGLQWTKNEDGIVVPDSIVYRCSRCKHEHHYEEAPKMVEEGKYVSKVKDKEYHQGFRYNALCVPDVYTWTKIANAQEDNQTIDARQYFTNFIMAKPFTAGKYDLPKISEQWTKIQSHSKKMSDPTIISAVYGAVDVQGYGQGGNYFVVIIRGVDERGNSYLLHYGIAKSIQELSAIADAKYYDIPVTLGVVDHGGFDHKKSELENWVLSRKNWLWGKGDTQHKEAQLRGWAMSQNVPRLILHNKYNYQAILLDAIYTRINDTGDYYWTLPETFNVTEDNMNNEQKEYMTQIKSMQPAERKQNGDEYQNWAPNSTDRHDYWDAEQMIQLMIDVSKRPPIPILWKKGNMPLFLRKELISEINRQNSLKKR